MTDLVKCNKCGHVLVKGQGSVSMFFGPGTKMKCLKCGNEHTFGEKVEVIGDKPKQLP